MKILNAALSDCKTCLDSENDCQGYVEQVPGGSKPSNSNRPRPSKGRSNSLIDESSQGESSPALSPPRKGQTLGLPSGTAGQHGNDQEGPSRKAQIGSAALQGRIFSFQHDQLLLETDSLSRSEIASPLGSKMCSVLSILRSHRHCAWIQTDGSGTEPGSFDISNDHQHERKGEFSP